MDPEGCYCLNLMCHTIQGKEPAKEKGKMLTCDPHPWCGLLSTTSKPGDGYSAFFLRSLCIRYSWEDSFSKFMQPSASKVYLTTLQLCVFLLPASAHL